MQMGGIHMKATGIIRKIDELGRIVLPIELRRAFDIGEKDAVEIYTDQDTIVLKKHQPACIFCGSADGVVEYMGKAVCEHCRHELQK